MTSKPNPVLGPICDVIRIANKLSDLTGVGTEYLVYDHIVRMKFYNGKLQEGVPPGNSEITLVPDAAAKDEGSETSQK